jgi:hypothetical protein
MIKPGRHGSITSGELEQILTRNLEFATVRRFGRGDGSACVSCSITGETLRGIGGGIIPEYSYMRDEAPRLVRGWRNICYELIVMRKLRETKETRKLLGTRFIHEAKDYGMRGALEDPNVTKAWMDEYGVRGHTGKDRENPYR